MQSPQRVQKQQEISPGRRQSAGVKRLSEGLFICGMLAPVLLAALVLIAAALSPGYNQIQETVSQLGITGRPYSEIVRCGFIIYGVLISGFAFALRERLGQGVIANAVVLLVIIHALGIGLLAIFRDDQAGVTLFLNNSFVHTALSQVAYWAFNAVILIFALNYQPDSSWEFFARYSFAAVAFAVISPAVFLFDFSVPFEGLLQRIIYGNQLLWTCLVSLKALSG